MGEHSATFEPATLPHMHPGRTAQILLNGEPVGFVAELSEPLQQAHELSRRVCVFDLDGDLLLARWGGAATGQYAALPKYPSVTRDVAPVFDKNVPFAQIERVARESAGELLESFALADVYEGANLGENKRSLTLRFTFRSPSGTLREADVEAALSSVRAALVALGAELRV